MKYDLNKYTYVEHARKDGVKEVIAISTYAGKTVRGVAKCDLRDADVYSVSDGKALAAARCNLKVAEKRVNRASDKFLEAEAQLASAKAYFEKMSNYLIDSNAELKEARQNLADIIEKM